MILKHLVSNSEILLKMTEDTVELLFIWILSLMFSILIKSKGVPGSLVVKIWCFLFHALASVSGWGTKILQDMWHGQRKGREKDKTLNVSVIIYYESKNHYILS